jgi:hypothetical protein
MVTPDLMIFLCAPATGFLDAGSNGRINRSYTVYYSIVMFQKEGYNCR